MKPYPLLFKPELKERIWGGQALAQFGFDLPEGAIGEAWLIGDHPHGTTSVANGPLKGMGLDEVREQYGSAFFGTKGSSEKNNKFPLLIKLLDCQDDLSIQVHPDDNYEQLPKGELGKTEMWYILAAKPGAKIIYGLQQNINRKRLTELIEQDRIMEGLQEVEVSAGDSFYIPAGTVHALGAGVLVAEVQQNSDTVYRLHDYNRPGLDGQPRELHIEHSLNVIDYSNSGASRMTTQLDETNTWLTLASSPFFIVEKGIVSNDTAWQLSTSAHTFTIIMICAGTGTLQWGDGLRDGSRNELRDGSRDELRDELRDGSREMDVKAGDCYLIPANLGDYALRGAMTVLRSYLGD